MCGEVSDERTRTSAGIVAMACVQEGRVSNTGNLFA